MSPSLSWSVPVSLTTKTLHVTVVLATCEDAPFDWRRQFVALKNENCFQYVWVLNNTFKI